MRRWGPKERGEEEEEEGRERGAPCMPFGPTTYGEKDKRRGSDCKDGKTNFRRSQPAFLKCLLLPLRDD